LKKKELLTLVGNFPDKPGVYLMSDDKNNVIYIGKAKSLKKRVSSYFRQGSFSSPRLKKLVDSINDISIIRTESEIEALILENRLIKQYQPFFNVDLKMNERYAYIKLTSEKFPRLQITRVRQKDNAVYIGPFVRVAEVRELLRLVERYLPLRTCNFDIIKQNRERPCIRYSLGRCLAPCCSYCTESEYRDRVANVLLLVQGQAMELVEKFRKEMDKSAKKMDFENAARLRDTIRAIWRVTRQRNSIPEISNGMENNFKTLSALQKILNLPTIPWRIDGFDVSHTGGDYPVGVVVVFEQGYPNISLYRKFNIKNVEQIDDFRSISETLTRRYKRCIEGEEPLPQLIIIDGGAIQLKFATETLKNLKLTTVPVISIAEKNEEVYLSYKKAPMILQRSDPVLRLLQYVRDEAHRFALSSHKKRRNKTYRRSILEDIPGIGRAKAARLITQFGSTKALINISENKLANTPGIGLTLAKRIKNTIKAEMQGEQDGVV